MFQLLTGDIMLFGAGWNKFIIKWGHGAFYDVSGKIIESVNRGVCHTDLFERHQGRKLCIMRLKGLAPGQYSYYTIRAWQEAKEMLEQEASWYDYLGIIRYVIPRLILQKLFDKPSSLGYKPNKVYWCFEVLRSAYGYAGVHMFADNIPPIDCDFINSPELEIVWVGTCDPSVLSI